MNRETIMIVCAILFIVGLAVGLAIGGYLMLEWGISKAVYFLRLQGYELQIDEGELSAAINQYQKHIDSKYPTLEDGKK